MKRFLSILSLLWVSFMPVTSAADEDQIFPATKSASGRYLLMTTEKYKKQGERGCHLLVVDPVSQKEQRPPLKIDDSFVEAPPRFVTRAAWNKSETLVAVSTGGRTWSAVHLYRLTGKEMAAVSLPNSGQILHRALPGFVEATRIFIMEPKWLDETTLQVSFSGTATWEKGEYEQFSFRSVWKVTGSRAVAK